MNSKTWRFATRLIHAGEPRPLMDGAVTLPIYQSSTFQYGGEKDYNDIRYIRLNNTPNHTSLSAKCAAIEGAETGLVTASGMAAISTTLLALVGEGEHILAQDSLYGGTHHLLQENLPKMGRKISFFSAADVDKLETLIRPETRVVYVEAVSNPLLRVLPLKKIVEAARRAEVLTVIDNTFPSPVNFNPIALGFDIVIHSATKYLNGHTDIVGGCVVGRHQHLQAVMKLLNHLGGSMDPHACFLLNRGLKTLGLRVAWQNDAALRLAKALEAHSRVQRVHYPGLASHPQHALAKELFRGFGGMLSFELDASVEETDRFIKRLTLPICAPSLGGVESLVTRPATTSHVSLAREERLKQGISDSLVRVSVGIEDPDDLIADFQKALDTR
jgi:cystathionine beta-lyase/cystathionine gamma-synthase